MSTLGHYRMQALRSQLDGWGGRAAVIAPALVFGIGAAFATQSVGGAIFGLLLGAIGGFALLWQGACTRAIRMALEVWGAERGLAVVDPAPLPEWLRWIDSTDGEMGPGLAGPLAGDEGGIGTAIGVRAAASVSLGPREFGTGLFNGLVGALSSWREVELESVDFEKRFALWVADGMDDLAVRGFFTPAVIARCLDDPPRRPAGDRRGPAVPEPRGSPDRARRPRRGGVGTRTVG